MDWGSSSRLCASISLAYCNSSTAISGAKSTTTLCLRNNRDNWTYSLHQGSSPESLIDFGNLKNFAIRERDLLRDDFGRKTNNLPTYFGEIAEVRNHSSHFQTMEEFDVNRAFDNMLIVARQLQMQELEEEIERLRRPEADTEPTAGSATVDDGDTLPWFKNVRPHLDIRQGNLDESVFAANLAEVALGNGREVYRDPATFFSKTYFTQGLKTVARRVVRSLNGGEAAENRVISLQTGFGGGKTHSLISLFHIARQGRRLTDLSSTQDLLASTGAPEFDQARVAVFTNATNDPTQGRREGDLRIRTLWGELAYQLGGAEAYELVRPNDESQTAPKGIFRQVLTQTAPALILIDELADYCVAAAGVTVGGSTLADQTISFIQELSEAIAQTDRCVLVATLPASEREVANSDQAAQILNSLANRLGRVGADTKPVAEDEIFEVIRHRLFDSLGDEAVIDRAVSAYVQLYEELRTEVPKSATTVDYRQRLRQSYPFHPELIDMFRIRWASHHDFQRTRGVLRLLASIVADLWQRRSSLVGNQTLIHTSEVNFHNLDALTGQLKRLYGNGFDAVITADVAGASSNAARIDQEKKEDDSFNVTQGVATTILLGSFGTTSANRGVSLPEIKLCVLKPHTFNHNSVNGVLDALRENAHYLYHSSVKQSRYWFHTEPNINILINQAKSSIRGEDEIDAYIVEQLQKLPSRVADVNLLIDPAADVPEQKHFSIVILGPQYQAKPQEIYRNTQAFIEQVATKKGSSERIYRNTLLFLVCSEVGITQLRQHVRELLACRRIKEDYHSQMNDDQRREIVAKEQEATQKVAAALVNAYSILAKHSAKAGIMTLAIKQFESKLSDQIGRVILNLLKTEEWLLDSVGLGTLRNNNLLPESDHPIATREVVEAFLRYDDKPMITGVSAVQQSLLRYCASGEFAIASGRPDNFTRMWFRQSSVDYFGATDESYWLVHPDDYQPPAAPESTGGNTETGTYAPDVSPVINEPVRSPEKESSGTKEYQKVVVSGQVNLENYADIFRSFIQPLVKNQLTIEIKITAKATEANPITENSPAYLVPKESAKQLGLDFEVEG